ncbi:MAG: DUF1569 domain-containing protein [Chloracidobacterium sp.]|nr:DUF1569 domain-containing protein [Chloracidobacterium sp.]
MPTIRNQTERTKLIERLNKLTGEEKAAWGKMNVNQMVSHLVQAGDLPFSASLSDKSTFFSRTFIKPLILYVLPMPKEVKTSPEMNQQESGRKPLEFDVDKGLVIDLINRLGDLPVDHDCKYHPFFGKMNAKEWAVIAYKHIDHHLKQFGV